MTYRQFHLLFNAPVMFILTVGVIVGGITLDTWLLLAGLCVVVVSVTFPWDNWAVGMGVWGFPDDRVWFRIRNLPIEEVAFFVIQTIQVSFATLLLMPLFDSPHPATVQLSEGTTLAVLCVVVAAVTAYRPLRKLRTIKPHTTYAVHLLYWISPFIVLQWIVGAEVLLGEWQAMVGATVILGTYLTLADVAAVRRGIWFFDHHLVHPRRLWGVLPWEEMAFFFLTSLLVAQSMILLAPPSAR